MQRNADDMPGMGGQDDAIAGRTTRYKTLTLFARVGFAARALIYLLVGVFAAAAAFNPGKQPHGITDVMQAVSGTGLRMALGATIGLGLACLAMYFAINGLWTCVQGSGRRRLLFAAGMLGDALIYGAVMLSIVALLAGWQADGEQQTQVWTAWVMAKPFGSVLVGIAGVSILGCGIGVIGWVMSSDIDDDVDLPEHQKRLIEPLGRYGLAGRGFGAALVGIYWISAALYHDPSKAHELGGALQAVQQHSEGWLLLLSLAVALTASALFDFVEALYHRPHPQLDVPGCST
jgi:hypothetical protein